MTNKTLCDIELEYTKLSDDLSTDEKTMQMLEISNSSINLLPENAFKDLTFESIEILGAQDLSGDTTTSSTLNPSWSSTPEVPPEYNCVLTISGNYKEVTCDVRSEVFSFEAEFIKLSNDWDDSEKFINSLSIKNASFPVIPQNAFKDFAIEYISLDDVNDLTSISSQAFNVEVIENLNQLPFIRIQN